MYQILLIICIKNENIANITTVQKFIENIYVLLLILNLIDKLNEFLIEIDKKVIQLGTRVEENII